MDAPRIVGVSTVFVLLFACPGLAGDHVPITTMASEIAEQVTLFQGEEPGDGFAGSVRSLGDVNGDGFADVAFRGPWGEEGGETVAYLFYGRETLPLTVDFSSWSTWGVRLKGPYAHRDPLPLAGLGDMDGDGYDDLLFGSCFPEFGTECDAYLLFGGPDLPREIDTSAFADCRGCAILSNVAATYQVLGEFSSAAAGDLNGDGLRDLVLGSDGAFLEGFPEKAGIAYIVFGSAPFPSTLNLSELGSTLPGCVITASLTGGGGSGSWLGYNVSADHDFNGDGLADLVVAAPRWDRDDGPGNEYGGAVFVLFGRTTWPVFLDLAQVDYRAEEICCILKRGKTSAWLGQDVLDGTDDFTGDGVLDLLMSDSHDTSLLSGRRLAPGAFVPEELQTVRLAGTSGAMNFLARAIGDWDGDGLNDVASMSPGDDSQISGAKVAGAVCIMPGRTEYPEILFRDQLDRIVGTATFAMFGEELVACDVNGDGHKDLVVTAPCPLWGGSGEPGKLYIIPRGIDLLGPLVCSAYAPQTSILSAGSRMFVLGRGFDEQTNVEVGDQPAETLVRPDSRSLVVRVPPVDSPGTYPVRVTRRDDAWIFPQEFRYYDSFFPREIDVLDLGDRGCTISTPCEGENKAWRLDPISETFEGGEDVTGDGLADVLLKHGGIGRSCSLCLCQVHLVHGSADLPHALTAPQDLPEWSTAFVTNPERACEGELFGDSAVAVGDMNGDGISELAISASEAHRIYVILGGEFPKGIVVMQDLMAEGQCVVIEDCPYEWNDEWVTCCKIGDVNGDGLADLGIVGTQCQDAQGMKRGSIVFFLGAEELPVTRSYKDLPILFGKRHSVAARVVQVRRVGNVDGDGFDDITFVAATVGPAEPGDDPQSTDYCIFFGRPSFPQEMTYEEELASGGSCKFLSYSSGWTCDIGGVGDQNGDGFADIDVYAMPWVAEPDPARGKLSLIYGGGRDKLCRLRSIHREADFDVTFEMAEGYHGEIQDVCGGRDFTGDGADDILLSDVHSTHVPPPSRAIMLFGGELEKKPRRLSEWTSCLELVNPKGYSGVVGNCAHSRYPTRFDFAGDVNGDGYEDVVVYSTGAAYVYFNPLGGLAEAFVRGDTNQDGRIDVANAITVLTYLFLGVGPLPCFDAGDANDDETLNIADAIRLLSHLFAGSGPLPLPDECGPDPQGKTLGCADSACR